MTGISHLLWSGYWTSGHTKSFSFPVTNADYVTGIYKAYDVRGIYPEQLDEKIARDIGAAFGTIFSGNIVVGHDVRLSSLSLEDSVIEGLLSAGNTVVDIGMVCTPMVPFSINELGYDSGMMVTASHNPPEYNGFKFFSGGGIPVSYESGIGEIEKLVERRTFKTGRGKFVRKNITALYRKFIARNFDVEKNKHNISISIDAANGPAGPIYRRILKTFVKTEGLYCKPDGRFPGHEPDPTKPSNLRDLQAKVRECKTGVGFAYDGDGDRLAVVDEKGGMLDTTTVFAMLIKDALERRPGARVVHDVLCSKFIDDIILKYGGVPVECRVGHTFISHKMLDVKAVIGGELSGHYYFAETHGADDALFATMRLIEILTKEKETLSEISKNFRSNYLSYQERFTIADDKKFKFVDALKEELARKYEMVAIDGVKIIFDRGWAAIRASNTEPKISVVYEASDRKAFDEIGEVVKGILENIPK